MFKSYENYPSLSTRTKGCCSQLLLSCFGKAFDYAIHCKLIHKLQLYGNSGPLLAWLTEFCRIGHRLI